MVSFFLPLARLRLSTLRPSCVDILLRKPCLLFPLRFDRFFRCFFIVRNYNTGLWLVKSFQKQMISGEQKLFVWEPFLALICISRREKRHPFQISFLPFSHFCALKTIRSPRRCFSAKIAVAFSFLFAIIGKIFIRDNPAACQQC